MRPRRFDNRLILAALLAWTASAVLLLAFSPIARAETAPRVQVLQSDVQRIVLELVVPDYHTRPVNLDGRTFAEVSIPGLDPVADEGKPQLPIKGALVGIPPGAEPTLTILADEAAAAPVAQPVLPVPTLKVQYPERVGKSLLPWPAGKTLTPDAVVYAANAPYPAQAARIASVGDWRSQHYVRVEFHPLQYNPGAGQIIFHRRVRIELTLHYPAGMTTQAIGGPTDEGPFEAVLEKSVVNDLSARNWRATSVAAPQMAASAAAYTGPNWYRVGVNADGMVRVTCDQLAAAAGRTLRISPSTLQVYDQGKELAIRVAGGGWGACAAGDTSDYVEFFGQALNTQYSDTNIYWLTFGKTTGKRMTSRSASGTGAAAISFTDTLHVEQNAWYISWLPMAEGTDHWYWTFLGDTWHVPTRTLPLQVPFPAAAPYTAILRVALAGLTTDMHHVRFFINDHLLADDTSWSGQTVREWLLPFPSNYLLPGVNNLRLEGPSDLGSPDVMFVNYLELTYQNTLNADGDKLRFRQDATGAFVYQVNGFSSPDVDLFDVTDPFNVSRFTGSTVTPNGGAYRLRFRDQRATPRQYLALTSAQRVTPASMSRGQPPAMSLHDARNAADYLVISYGGFIPNLQPLLNQRAAQKLRVKVVDVQSVYDEFSDGAMDAQALRDFLGYAYANWQRPAPSFVLLVGDATYDPRRYCASNPDCPYPTMPNSTLVPAYLREVDPWGGETVSDNRLVTLDPGDPLPSMAVGRLPANTAAEVDAMVQKILNYENNPPAGDWKTSTLFVADAAYDTAGQLDKAGNFWLYSDQVAADPYYVPAPYTVNRIYYNPCDPKVYPQCALANPPYAPYTNGPATEASIIAAINNGQLVVNFVGHAFYNWWASDVLFQDIDLPSLTNGGKTPVMLEMTCFTGYFIDPLTPSLGELEVRLPGNGAVASWAASGFGVSTGHNFLDEGFFDAVFEEGITRIGSAAVYGKANLWLNGGFASDLLDTFTLFGDPAMPIATLGSADVAITQVVEPQGAVRGGSSVTYTLTYTNTGPGLAEGVRITDTLPAGLLAASYVSSGAPLTPTMGTRFAWRAQSLAPGAGGTITVTAVLDTHSASYPGNSLVNVAFISTTTPQTFTGNDTSATSIFVVLQNIFMPFIINW